MAPMSHQHRPEQLMWGLTHSPDSPAPAPHCKVTCFHWIFQVKHGHVLRSTRPRGAAHPGGRRVFRASLDQTSTSAQSSGVWKRPAPRQLTGIFQNRPTARRWASRPRQKLLTLWKVRVRPHQNPKEAWRHRLEQASAPHTRITGPQVEAWRTLQRQHENQSPGGRPRLEFHPLGGTESVLQCRGGGVRHQ